VGQIADELEAAFSRLRALNDPQGIYARMPMDIAIR